MRVESFDEWRFVLQKFCQAWADVTLPGQATQRVFCDRPTPDGDKLWVKSMLPGPVYTVNYTVGMEFTEIMFPAQLMNLGNQMYRVERIADGTFRGLRQKGLSLTRITSEKLRKLGLIAPTPHVRPNKPVRGRAWLEGNPVDVPQPAGAEGINGDDLDRAINELRQQEARLAVREEAILAVPEGPVNFSVEQVLHGLEATPIAFHSAVKRLGKLPEVALSPNFGMTTSWNASRPADLWFWTQRDPIATVEVDTKLFRVFTPEFRQEVTDYVNRQQLRDWRVV